MSVVRVLYHAWTGLFSYTIRRNDKKGDNGADISCNLSLVVEEFALIFAYESIF